MSESTLHHQERVERENIALARREGTPLRQANHYLIEVLDSDGHSCLIEISDPVPTGRQILSAAGRTPVENHLLLLTDDRGVLEEVNLDETVGCIQPGG